VIPGVTDKRKSILVVDDDEQILLVWRGALEGHAKHWHVETAQSGLEALAKIRTTAFDLVVTDLRMPGMDGCDLTVAARQLVGDIPVIWITAYPQPGALAKAEDLAVCRFLNKPMSVAQIRQVVAQVLEDTN
jgi:CheY-like chemotaxis protein